MKTPPALDLTSARGVPACSRHWLLAPHFHATSSKRVGRIPRMHASTPSAARRFAHHLWSEWIRPLALPLLLVASAKSALADINYVPSGSMKPTIHEGEVVFINKLAYDLRVPFTLTRIAEWSAPSRGDIVVCFSPADQTRLVKRVIALPGDTVWMENDVLIINGVRSSYRPATEAATRHLSATERERAIVARESTAGVSRDILLLRDLPALRSFGPITVPANAYFVLGDNRNNSHDSRFFGYIPRSAIVGRAEGVVLSADPDRWFSPRWDRFCTSFD